MKIVLTQKAEKQFRKLENKTAKKILSYLHEEEAGKNHLPEI